MGQFLEKAQRNFKSLAAARKVITQR